MYENGKIIGITIYTKLKFVVLIVIVIIVVIVIACVIVILLLLLFLSLFSNVGVSHILFRFYLFWGILPPISLIGGSYKNNLVIFCCCLKEILCKYALMQKLPKMVSKVILFPKI